jgi:hypothetical protein
MEAGAVDPAIRKRCIPLHATNAIMATLRMTEGMAGTMIE